MKNFYKNPFETFENITKTVVNDVLPPEEVSPDKQKPLPPQQKSQIKSDDANKAAQIRQNITKINQEIQQIRQKKTQQAQQAQQAKQVEKKQDVVQKRQKESVLAKLINSRKGSKESMKGASG